MANQRLEATPDERVGFNRLPMARRASAGSFGVFIVRTLNQPRVYMWAGRLLPAIAWAFWLVALLVPGFGPSTSPLMSALFAAWVLSLAAYIVWVFFVLPQLLFEGEHKGIRVGYFLFAGFTAGIGPVVLYFRRVDCVLRQMAKTENQ